MTFDIQTKKYTVEEFLALPENDSEYELVNGEIIEVKKEGPSKEHGKVIVKIAQALQNFLDDNPRGDVFAGSACRMSKSYTKPDVAFLLKDRIPPEMGVDLPYPDIAVEVMSQSDKFFEVRDKVQAYLDDGTHLVWVVFPPDQLVFVYRPNEKVKVFSTDDELDTAPVLTGFKLAVNKIFE
jgi:Uma2 family endonuclease